MICYLCLPEWVESWKGLRLDTWTYRKWQLHPSARKSHWERRNALKEWALVTPSRSCSWYLQHFSRLSLMGMGAKYGLRDIKSNSDSFVFLYSVVLIKIGKYYILEFPFMLSSTFFVFPFPTWILLEDHSLTAVFLIWKPPAYSWVHWGQYIENSLNYLSLPFLLPQNSALSLW